MSLNFLRKLNPLTFPRRILNKFFLSELSKNLIESWSENGGDWHYNTYWLTHKKSGTQLWVGNGRWFFNVSVDGKHDGSKPIGLFERHLLWGMFKKITKAGDKARAKKVHAELIAKLAATLPPAPTRDTDEDPPAVKPKATRAKKGTAL